MKKIRRLKRHKRVILPIILLIIIVTALALTLWTPDNVDNLLVLAAQSALIILSNGV